MVDYDLRGYQPTWSILRMIEPNCRLGLTIHKPVFEGITEGLNTAQLGAFEITSFQTNTAAGYA